MLAHYKAKRGKSLKPQVQEFSQDLLQNLSALQTQILSGQVAVGNYHYFTVYDPKERIICAADYPERVLHHAIMNVCHPVFETFQISDSYATRLQKGTFKAIERARTFQKQYRFYCKFDIRKYFDSIDHHTLMLMLQRRFKDPLLLSIFETIIASYHAASGKGVPIGNLTSQYFSNHYLALLDHFVKERLQAKAYVRYMDDFAVWHNNPVQLEHLANQIEQFIQSNLLLKLKTNFINTTLHGLTFLGFRLFPNKILLSVRSKKRFEQKNRTLSGLLAEGQISQKQYQIQATGLLTFVQKAYSKKFRKTLLQTYKVCNIHGQ